MSDDPGDEDVPNARDVDANARAGMVGDADTITPRRARSGLLNRIHAHSRMKPY